MNDNLETTRINTMANQRTSARQHHLKRFFAHHVDARATWKNIKRTGSLMVKFAGQQRMQHAMRTQPQRCWTGQEVIVVVTAKAASARKPCPKTNSKQTHRRANVLPHMEFRQAMRPKYTWTVSGTRNTLSNVIAWQDQCVNKGVIVKPTETNPPSRSRVYTWHPHRTKPPKYSEQHGETTVV
jgi:hypothetical protein